MAAKRRRREKKRKKERKHITQFPPPPVTGSVDGSTPVRPSQLIQESIRLSRASFLHTTITTEEYFFKISSYTDLMADIYNSPYHINRLSDHRGIPNTVRMAHDGNRKRDVKHHLLFEVSTEVANRGWSPSSGNAIIHPVSLSIPHPQSFFYILFSFPFVLFVCMLEVILQDGSHSGR